MKAMIRIVAFALRVCPGLWLALFDGVQKTVKNGVLQLGVVEVIAQAFGERDHPLPHRQVRKDMIDEMRRNFGHAPGGVGRAHAAALARVGDDEVVAAVGATGGKSVCEDVAVEVAAEFAFGQRGGRPTQPVIVQRQPGSEMRFVQDGRVSKTSDTGPSSEEHPTAA